MQFTVASDQARAVAEVVAAAGEQVTIAGKTVLAIVGTRGSYLYQDAGYTEAEALTLTLPTSSLPTDARPGAAVEVRRIAYTIADIEADDGAVATITLV